MEATDNACCTGFIRVNNKNRFLEDSSINEDLDEDAELDDLLLTIRKESTPSAGSKNNENVDDQNFVSKKIKNDIYSDFESKLKSAEDSDGSNDDLESKKKTVLNSISFSDTFDLLSEEVDRVPDEVPLFVDDEPVHFTEVNIGSQLLLRLFYKKYSLFRFSNVMILFLASQTFIYQKKASSKVWFKKK